MPLFKSLALALVAAGAMVTTALAQTAPAPQAHLARNLAATCANCHGTNGNARGDMKPLAGVSADKIVSAMADFKSGAMPATIMHQIAKGYTDEQIRLIASYLAAQKPAAAK
jgi:cytochrome subunit of sulfide dehydrogenase